VEYEWFPSFDAVPGVSWHPLVPVAHASAGVSDAAEHWQCRLEIDRQPSAAMIADLISRVLAMRGTRRDYHFDMLVAWRALYLKRRDDPRALAWVEALCLADISLMESGPQLVFTDPWKDRGEAAHLAQPAFAKLSNLYQREGFLVAAVDIERRCAALGAIREMGEEVIARQAALLEEDGR
jgi:hypothetical protein